MLRTFRLRPGQTLYRLFYSQINQNTNKKSSLLFWQAALFDPTNFLKQTTAYLPEFILQATTSYRYCCGSCAS